MERIDALKPAGGKLADYPFVRRLRNRRLIVYLHLQGFQSAYDRIVHETDLYMSRRHLKQLVACGQWAKALKYIRRFLPPAIGGVEARTLHIFLDTFWAVDNAAACSTGAPVTTAIYRHGVSRLTTMCTGNTKLSSILHKIHHKPLFRASLDWKLVREKASLIADDLAYHSPELRRSLLLPNGPKSPHELLPIGPRRTSRQRRERSRRPTTSAIVTSYLNRKRSLPSSSPVFGLNSEGRNRVVDLIEDCINAGRLPELHQGHLLQSSAMEGAFSTPFSPTMLGMTGPAKNIETSSVRNAGLPNYLWHPSVANSGAFITPFSQTMVGTTGPAKNIETSSVTNAGNPTFTGLPNYLFWYPPVANSDIPVSEPAETPGFTSATNAGVVD